MKTYTAILAHAVQCYASVEVEAESYEEALEKIKSDQTVYDLFGRCQPEWDSSDCERIVSLEDDSTGEMMVEDFQLGTIAA